MTEENILETVSAATYVFTDDSVCSSEAYERFVDACGQWLKEHCQGVPAGIYLRMTQSEAWAEISDCLLYTSAMMYKIEGEDLYLIGTSEHSMIGKFINTQLTEDQLPQTLTSYSPCFRKEKGAHGIEERGVYRIHQFEKQEMIVVCKPEDSMEWYEKLWKNTVDLFRSMDIPVRTLECCSGDLADLKVKSVDVEAWSPRQKKYFEVGSCSNLGDAQARRLGIRVKGENGNYFAHTLNNTVVAPPRMLIAFLENNLQADGSVRIPEVLRPYMGGTDKIVPKK